MNRTGANLRGVLIIVAGILAAALADKNLIRFVPDWAVSLLGLLMVGLTLWRAFIDQSLSDSVKGFTASLGASVGILQPAMEVGLSAGKQAVSDAADRAAREAEEAARREAEEARLRIEEQMAELRQKLEALPGKVGV